MSLHEIDKFVNTFEIDKISIPDADKFHLGRHPEQSTSSKQTIRHFAKQGAKFVKLLHNDKAPFEANWQNKPRTAAQAEAHTGNIGILLGKHSDRIIAIDLDCNAPELFAKFPQLNDTLVVHRDNAPDRAKVFIKLTDKLPRSTNWKADPTQKQPDIELLSTGRQAFVIGTHPSGAVMRNNGKDIVEMTFGDLSRIWRSLTGQELPDPTTTRENAATERTQRLRNAEPFHTDNTLANRVRGLWTVLDVFEHHNVTGDHKDEGAGEIRILGNGGLIVDTVGDRWYQFSGEVGGDCISAWAWCTRGTVDLSGGLFVEISREMLEARGESLPDRPSLNWDAMIDRYSQPDQYTKGRNNPFDRQAMIQMLSKMSETHRTIIKMSTRELGELMGAGHVTAWKALQRLIKQGLLEYPTPADLMEANIAAWHDAPVYEESDELIMNQFTAKAYKLPAALVDKLRELSKLDTGDSPSVRELRSVINSDTSADAPAQTADSGQALDSHTLQAWADSDAFQWGAKVKETAVRLGRGSLDIIAALVVCNDMSTADIAEATGRSRSGLSPLLWSLVDLGLAEVYKEGRASYWYLRENWQDILQRYISSLTTFCRTIKRKIRHLDERIRRVGTALHFAESGFLRARLCDLLDKWRQRLLLWRSELTRLRKMAGVAA